MAKRVSRALLAGMLGALVLATGVSITPKPAFLADDGQGGVIIRDGSVFNTGGLGVAAFENAVVFENALADAGLQKKLEPAVDENAGSPISDLGNVLINPDGGSQLGTAVDENAGSPISDLGNVLINPDGGSKQGTVVDENAGSPTSDLVNVPINPAGGAKQRGSPIPSGFLTGPSEGDPLDIALKYIRLNQEALGLTDDDLSDVVVKDRYFSKHNKVTHIYLRQRLGGIEVFNGDININITGDGSVINLGNGFIPDLKNSVKVRTPKLTAINAVERAAQHLGVAITQPLAPRQPARGVAQETVLSNGGISEEDIPVKLIYQPPGGGVARLGANGEVRLAVGEVRLAWDMVIIMISSDHWWNLRVDAVTGDVLSQNDWIAQDQYEVFAIPKEYPDDGSRSVEVNPANSTASPFGWHDTDGDSDPDFTITRGNNVHAYADRDANNTPDTGSSSEPDGGASLDFSGSLVALDLAEDPSTYTKASIANLFYWNNVIHDVFYLYGYDEAAGNFQVNNYGNGGVGNDDVRAEAQDGGGVNNANFGTPPDGSRPRMQMFEWNFTTPRRDGDFSNNIIVHEYGHGISNRLTGGPSNANCLNSFLYTEQMGEGWSDFFALVLTADSSEAATTSRGIGTYVVGQPPTGGGIRPNPYTTDMAVNPTTYGNIGGLVIPHQVGYAWATMLWEVYWALVAEHGFNADIYGGHATGGNNLALQLVVDGLKLQGCGPGFVDGRDAILLADQVLNGGANKCIISTAFAKRGLGDSAHQGSSGNITDGVEAFDLPASCRLGVSKSASPSPAPAGSELTYTLTATNNSGVTRTGVTISDTVPTNTVYVAGSASDGGSESGGTVSFPAVTMNTGASITRTFRVTVNANVPVGSQTHFTDDMESGSGPWTVTGSGATNWVLGTTNPHSGTDAWFAADLSTESDQRLEMASAVALGTNATLSFWHDYDLEEFDAATGFDGGVVEISANGGAWTDLGSLITQNGYTHTIAVLIVAGRPVASAVGGRRAFSGNSGGYVQTLVDLSSFSGTNVRIRFRLGTDRFVGDNGWYVDDVVITGDSAIPNTACVAADGVNSTCDTVSSTVSSQAGCAPPASGNWTLTSDCTLDQDDTAPQNVIVKAGVALTIAANKSLDIDFSTYHLLIEAQAKVIIKSGAKIH